MNKWIGMGRLTRDPEVRVTQSGKSVAKMTLATDRNGKDAGADFISLQAWDKSAEFAGKYLQKGTKIAVIGRITTGSYEDANGAKVYTTVVTVENIEFAESKNGSSAANDPIKEAESKGFMNIPDGVEEELPFM